jgi:LPS O-antigen subunit length determinant protein (WzzB/FepE family)
LLILKIDSPYLLMLATALIGGVVAGFAAMTGSFLRKKKVTSPSY